MQDGAQVILSRTQYWIGLVPFVGQAHAADRPDFAAILGLLTVRPQELNRF
jgi:hypothetical protein